MRGLTRESVRSFRLGFVGAEPAAGHDDYVNRLSIPYVTRAGLVTIRYRAIVDGHKPKYINPAKDPNRLYNPEAFFQRSSWIAICEGEIDTITATQCGIPAVGVKGVDSWEKWFSRPFKGYRVCILADGDPEDAVTGRRPGRELVRRIQEDLPEAVPFYMPEGDDVNSYVLKYGAEGLRKKIGV